jgi:hypothetical protein
MSEPVESFISKPALLLDLPEVASISSEFNYNFFTADERVNTTSNAYGRTGFTSTTVDLSNTSTFTNNSATSNVTDVSLRSFYGRNAVYPRFVKVSIAKPPVEINHALTIKKEQIGDNVAREAASNTFGRIGVSVVDTSLDQTVYRLLSGSLSIPSPESTESASQLLIEAIKNSIQPDGYRYAKTDARQGASFAIENALQGLDFGFSYLPNVAGTIADASLNSTKNIYADEISSTRRELEDLQERAIANSRPYIIRTSDYEAEFNFVSDTRFGFETNKNVLIGYIVQKFELTSDGTVNSLKENIITTPSATSFLDPDVAYGRNYRYRVISLYACSFQVNQQITSPGSFEEDRTVTKYVLFASRGRDTSVICEEHITPPPPVDLRFRYRADNTGLSITWNFPVNLQRDIKKFQVFRRRSTSEPYQLLQVYDFDDSISKSADPENVPESLITRSLFPVTIHKDLGFTKNSRFIYAVCAIDAHGFTSNYSVQLEATYDRYKNKVNTKIISRSDAPKPYPNIFLNQDTFVDTMKMSGYTRLNVYFDPEYITVSNSMGVDQNHIVFNNDRGDDNIYKLLVVNTDFQQSKTLDMKINDSFVTPPVITPSTARVFKPT